MNKNCSKKISVVLSFYNEESVLPELLSRMRTMFTALIDAQTIGSYELVFVNDNSSDRSEALLRSELTRGDIVLVNMTHH